MGKIYVLDDVHTASNSIRSQAMGIREMITNIQSSVESFVNSELDGAAYQALKGYFTSTYLDILTVVSSSCEGLEYESEAYRSAIDSASEGEVELREDELLGFRRTASASLAALQNMRLAMNQAIAKTINDDSSVNDALKIRTETYAEKMWKELIKCYDRKLEILERIEAVSASYFANSEAEVSQMIQLLSVDNINFSMSTGQITVDKACQERINEIKERQKERLMRSFGLTSGQAEILMEMYSHFDIMKDSINAIQKGSDSDQKVFYDILDKKYLDAFTIKPDQLSDSTKAFLTNYALYLMNTGSIGEIENMTNAIYAPKYILSKDGTPLNMVFHEDYFLIIREGLNAKLELEGLKIADGELSKEEFNEYIKNIIPIRNLAHYFAGQKHFADVYCTIETMDSGTTDLVIGALEVKNLNFFERSFSFDIHPYSGVAKTAKDADIYGWSGSQASVLDIRQDAQYILTAISEYKSSHDKILSDFEKEKIRALEEERNRVYKNAGTNMILEAVLALALEKSTKEVGWAVTLLEIAGGLRNDLDGEKEIDQQLKGIYLESHIRNLGGIGSFKVMIKGLTKEGEERIRKNLLKDIEKGCYYNPLDDAKAQAWSEFKNSGNALDEAKNIEENLDALDKTKNIEEKLDALGIEKSSSDREYYMTVYEDRENLELSPIANALLDGKLSAFINENGQLDQRLIDQGQAEIDEKMGKKHAMVSISGIQSYIEDQSKRLLHD